MAIHNVYLKRGATHAPLIHLSSSIYNKKIDFKQKSVSDVTSETPFCLKSNATHHPLVLPKLMWLLKSPLDQNLRVIYQKFNGDFKSHINFGRTKGGQGDDV
jgi:hypothetical protein